MYVYLHTVKWSLKVRLGTYSAKPKDQMRYLCSNTRWYRISSCALQSLSGYFVSLSQYVLSHLTLFGELLCLKIHKSFTPFLDLASLVSFARYVYSIMGIEAHSQTFTSLFLMKNTRPLTLIPHSLPSGSRFLIYLFIHPLPE